MKTAIIAITPNGAAIGRRLAEGLQDAELFLPPKLAANEVPAIVYHEELRELVRRLWQVAEGLVCIMATGIVVRVTADLLQGKDVDPAVVVIDDAGRFAISLLSGHLGGANRLAERCASLLGAAPVITTATDANGLPSFDVAAADQGWVIDDLSRVKILNSLLLAHADVAVVDSTEKLCAYFGEVQNTRFYADFSSAAESGAEGFVFVTNRQIPEKYRSESLLVLRPKNLVLGIGCNSGTAIEEIENVVSRALERLSLSFKSVCCIATAEAKRNEAGLQEYAARYSIALSFFQADELNGTLTPSPPSTHALKAIGAIGVAEPAAVLASGNGKLLLNKIRSGNITLAIAEMG